MRTHLHVCTRHILQPLKVLFRLRVEKNFPCRAPNPEAITEKLTDLTP